MKSLSVEQVASLTVGMRVGIVVAHPDDETLWAGGLIAALDKPVVFACSIPVRDPIRADRFFDACRVLGAEARILPHVETTGEILPHLFTYTNRLHEFDCIVTHNELGEYGHIHHKQVSGWVTQEARCPVMFFGYGIACEHSKLNEYLLSRKREALHCYDHYSPSDGGMKKSLALEIAYGDRFDFNSEGYFHAR